MNEEFHLKCHQWDAGSWYSTPEILWLKTHITWRNSGCSSTHPPGWVDYNSHAVTAQEHSWAMSRTIHEWCLERDETPFSLQFVIWGSGAVKTAVQRRKETKDWKQGGNGCDPYCQRHNIIRDGSNISIKVPLTCLVGPGVPGPTVTDPPLCSVLQMGGGVVQTPAAGVHSRIHAAGWETQTIT